MVVFLWGLFAAVASKAMNHAFYYEVLGPLNQISDWDTFANQLSVLKQQGVRAMATDIWWAVIQPDERSANGAAPAIDWSYYDKLSGAIIAGGLQWVPIFSTHSCGGLGQSCNIPIPQWTGIRKFENYVDIYGNPDYESWAPWRGSYPYDLIGAIYSSFASHYGSNPLYKGKISRLDLSGGTSGELRYPAYDYPGWTYPSQGRLWAYSTDAVADFRSTVMKKYNSSLDTLSKAWGTAITDVSQITPPCDSNDQMAPVTRGVCAGKAVSNSFLYQGISSVYGNDFMSWYQGSLIQHSAKLASKAHAAFDAVFPGTPIAMKFAGVHWQYTASRSAEHTAGYYSYSSLLSAIKSQGLVATWTALEKDPDASANANAQALAWSFFSTCQGLQLDCGAENAQQVYGDGWNNMYTKISQLPISRISFLRYDDVAYWSSYASAFQGTFSALQY
ncbi:hypothetical protein HDV03_000871 [Kappamyces sp. JEL0829]|nr:hypothetical protein HDV03_000871 [Kappamyces sp. JEL0829]